MEEVGMADAQYKDRVRDWVAVLERVMKLGVSDEAAKEIEAEIERRKKLLDLE